MDVYLDEINRSEVEEMLLKFARDNSGYQYVLISPQRPNNCDEDMINVIVIGN